MTSQSYFVKELPYDIQANVRNNDTISISVDTRLYCGGMRFDNGTGQALDLVTNPPLPGVAGTFVDSGISTRGFPNGIWQLKLTANDDGPVFIHLSEMALPDTSSELKAGGDVGSVMGTDIAELSATDSFTQATVLSVPTGSRARLLGFRVQLTATLVAGAANGTSRFWASIRTPGPQRWGDCILNFRTITAVNASLWDSVDSGYIPLLGQGEVCPDGFDLIIEVIHDTMAGGVPNNIRTAAVGIVNAVVEPTPT